MIKIKLLIAPMLTAMILFNSCEKSELEAPDTSEDTELEEDEIISLNFSIHKLDDETDADKEEDREYSFLGFGYDITGKYAHKSAIRKSIINIPAFVEEHPNRFRTIRTLSSTFHEIYTANAAQFTKKLTDLFLKGQEDDTFTYFKESITHSFPETDANSAEYVYGRYELEMRHRRLSLNTTSQLLTDYVSEEFQADCRLLDAAQIIEKYGTHTLVSLYIGAKLSIDYQAEYTGSKGQQASENSFKAGLHTYFEPLPFVFPPHDLNVIRGISNPVIAVEAIGGNPSHDVKVNIEPEENPLITIADWRENITEENATFVYLDGLNNLMPISEFILDADKKEAVEDYIHEYIKLHEVKIN